MTLASDLDRRIDRGASDPPVLAVVDVSYPADSVLARSTFVGQAFGCPVKLVLLAPRVGFSTDAALVARAHQRIRDECDKVLAAARQHVPNVAAVFVWYARTPVRKPIEQARRAAQRAIRRYDARAVILAPHLSCKATDW